MLDTIHSALYTPVQQRFDHTVFRDSLTPSGISDDNDGNNSSSTL
mgnify:CR=1 FL=1